MNNKRERQTPKPKLKKTENKLAKFLRANAAQENARAIIEYITLRNGNAR